MAPVATKTSATQEDVQSLKAPINPFYSPPPVNDASGDYKYAQYKVSSQFAWWLRLGDLTPVALFPRWDFMGASERGGSVRPRKSGAWIQ